MSFNLFGAIECAHKPKGSAFRTHGAYTYKKKHAHHVKTMKAHMPVSSKSLARAYHVPAWPEVEAACPIEAQRARGVQGFM